MMFQFGNISFVAHSCWRQ